MYSVNRPDVYLKLCSELREPVPLVLLKLMNQGHLTTRRS
jgi:hypothetical protein